MKNKVELTYNDMGYVTYRFIDASEKCVNEITLMSDAIRLEMNIHIINWIRDGIMSIAPYSTPTVLTNDYYNS